MKRIRAKKDRGMNFLLTNDDGITAPGIWVAARALSALGHVTIVAPSMNYSGYGAAAPAASEVRYRHWTECGGLDYVTAFSVDAPPATCVQVGLSGALTTRQFQIAVSGINDLRNVGRDILYSGTVGAALTAQLLGVPAVAISLDGSAGGVLHWETAGKVLAEVISRWFCALTADTPLFNVNVPNVHQSELGGYANTYLSRECFLTHTELRARSDSHLTFSRINPDQAPYLQVGSDLWTLARNQVSITPLNLFPADQTAQSAAPLPIRRYSASGLAAPAVPCV
jgi:5'-nucleotidase